MYAPMYFFTLYANMSIANCARLFPSAANPFKSLISPVICDIPYNPDFLFSTVIISSIDKFSFFITNSNIAGSKSPDLVPIIKPSNGVNPIEVSTHTPPFIAAILEPFPKWHEIIFISSFFLPNFFAASSDINLCELPCAPYLFIAYFS